MGAAASTESLHTSTLYTSTGTLRDSTATQTSVSKRKAQEPPTPNERPSITDASVTISRAPPPPIRIEGRGNFKNLHDDEKKHSRIEEDEADEIDNTAEVDDRQRNTRLSVPVESQRPSVASRLAAAEVMDSVAELQPLQHHWRHEHGKHEEKSKEVSIGELTLNGIQNPGVVKIKFDTFVKEDGRCLTVYREGEQMFYVDWEAQQYYPFPDEWLKTGRLLHTHLPDPSSQAPPQTDPPQPPDHYQPSNLTHPLLHSATDPRILTFTDSHYRHITTHLFPLLRPVRCALNPTTLRWEPMSLSWELEIPEIASTVDLIDSHLHPSQPVAAPTRGGFPTINDRDPEQRQRDRENILMALRERGYDLGMTLRDAEEGKMGAANCLDDIAERFFRELGGVGKNGGGTTTMRTYRAPIYKAWEDQVHALQDRIKVLEQALYERDKECRLAQSREKEKSVELEKALKSVAGVEEERGRWRKALMNAGNDLDAANERGRRLEEELEIFKRGDVGRRHEGMVDLLTEKEEHVGRMRFVVATLQRRLEKVGEARRKERRVLEETLAAVKRLKDDHAHLLSDLRHHMQSLPLITSRAITPLTTQIRHLSLDLSHLRTLYRVDRRAVQLLRQSLPNRSTSPPVSVLCRVRPDERVRVTGRSAVTVLGDSEVVVSAKRGTRMFRFEKAFGGKAGQKDLFAEIEPHLPHVLDGSNLCVIAYGQTGAGKTFTLQGTPAAPGLTILTIQKLFQLARERPEEKFSFSASCLEIYNENVYDLFSNPDTPLTPETPGSLKLRPKPAEPTFPTPDTLISHITRSLAQRTLSSLSIQSRRTFTLNPTHPKPLTSTLSVAPTSTGSLTRSHIILTVSIKSTTGPRVNPNSATGGLVHSDVTKVTFVDLAGSEAAWDAVDAVNMSGHRQRSVWGSVDLMQQETPGVSMLAGGIGPRRLLESLFIDRSLVSLSTLLRGISVGVPFRPAAVNDNGNFAHVDSMLARVLAGVGGAGGGVSGVHATGFGGRVGKTFVVVNVSPVEDHAGETMRSLSYGEEMRWSG